ncbi:MAG: DUF6505 family protein [Bosea sp. (in: a-proteobacteria)]
MLKLPRTIRLDPSDTFVFRHAAQPGEWAVTGAFLFADAEPDALDAKARAAFRSGFLGLESFGWSTLVTIVEASEAERDAAIELLATQFTEKLGAPDMQVARAAAAEEIAFAASLCHHPVGTLVALARGVENGELKERFRTLTPRDPGDAKRGVTDVLRAFEFIDDDADKGIEETVDLLGLGKIGEARR